MHVLRSKRNRSLSAEQELPDLVEKTILSGVEYSCMFAAEMWPRVPSPRSWGLRLTPLSSRDSSGERLS